MSTETDELLMLKGLVSDASPQEQAQIKERVAIITDLVRASPSPTLIAISIVALQVQISPKDFGISP